MLQKTENTIEIINRTFNSKSDENTVFLTSSFQTQSMPLLHIIKGMSRNINVIFIDTGFLFSETYQFVEEIKRLFDLNIMTIKSDKSYIEQIGYDGYFQYTKDVDYCCKINKVDPLNQILEKGDYWISGVRRDQTSVRKKLKVNSVNSNGVNLIHPMLEWTAKDIYSYINKFNLPKHPLEKRGYFSVGCVPCTHSYSESGRGGRWVGNSKTECGLHTKKG